MSEPPGLAHVLFNAQPVLARRLVRARIDIGRAASEVEREWLYRVLAERYSLATA